MNSSTILSHSNGHISCPNVNPKTPRKHRGFTLIELMIVVAIIGILAAVAIPAYSNYLKRSQVAEALGLMAGFKTPSEEWYGSKGTWPTNISQLGGKTSGKYTSTISISPLSSTNLNLDSYCVGVWTYVTYRGITIKICAGFRMFATMKDIPGDVFLTYDAEAKYWHCHSTSMKPEYLPTACK